MYVLLFLLMYVLPPVRCSEAATEVDFPILVKLVAPAYPRSAKDQRIMGKTLTRLTINREGVVTEAKTILAHPVFETYVLDALKQWRFRPSDHEHTLEVTCLFELVTDKCEGTTRNPITPETHVSAELPNLVHIKTGLRCIEDATAGN